jgi:hypothetical protein
MNSNGTPEGADMVKVLKRILTPQAHGELRWSRGIGPHVVPRR